MQGVPDSPPNAKAKRPAPPALTLKLENQDGGPGQLQPLVSRTPSPLAKQSDGFMLRGFPALNAA